MTNTLLMGQADLPEPKLVPDPMIGLVIHGYVVTHPICSGGMGRVYEARHLLISRRVAVKVLQPQPGLKSTMAERFLLEARAINAIKHRNVVEILNFGALPDGTPYLMMELLEGQTLAQLIARDAPMRPLQALQICREILCGLAAMHQVGVIHRDLKPDNLILVTESTGELIVKVLDFGLAEQVGGAAAGALDPPGHERQTRPRLLVGTPAYINPEQAMGAPVGAQGDLYSLGVILFEMLSGRTPFSSSSPQELLQMHRAQPAPLLSTQRSSVHPELDAFVAQLLAKAPEHRPPSARVALETVARLEQLVGERRPGGARRRGLIAGLAAALLGLGLVNGWTNTRSRSNALDDQLASVDDRIATAHLAGAGGDSALDHLLAARSLDAHDARVQARAAQLAEVFRQLAQRALDRGDDPEAAVHLQALTLIEPGKAEVAQELRAAEARVRNRIRQPRSIRAASTDGLLRSQDSPPAK